MAPGVKPVPMDIYSEDKMDRLYQGALRVLRETGCGIDHDGLLEAFEQRGQRVDRARRRVFITSDIVRELLEPQPGKDWRLSIPSRPPKRFPAGGSFPKLYDWKTRTSRLGVTADLLELVRTFGAMPEFHGAGRILTLSDAPQAIEPIMATALVIQHTAEPGGGEVYRADNIPYLVELGEIATGKPRCTDFVPPWICTVPPLKISRDEAERIVEKARWGVPSVATPMPSSGATAPVTREGTVVILLAETIAIWLCSRTVDPELPLNAVCASSSFDMRSGTCAFSSPECILQDCAAAQILRRYFGVPAYMAANYVDAKTPGVQATYEKLFKAWWSYLFLGQASVQPGLLEAGQTFCLAQALLDVEVWQTAGFLLDPPEPDEEVPFDDIERVAREGGSFLDTDHTLRLFREVLHSSRFLDRTARASDAEERAKADGLLDRCQAEYERVRAEAPEYRAPEEVSRAVDAVVERAKKALL